MERYSCKHWVQLLFDSGLSSLGPFFPLVDLGLGAAVGSMRLESLVERNTGYSCYLTAVLRRQGQGGGPFALSISDPSAEQTPAPGCFVRAYKVAI